MSGGTLGGGTVHYDTGVTGYLAPQEIWHPRTIFPRQNGIPPGNLEPPSNSGNIASLTLYFLGYLEPHAKFPRISETPSEILQ